MKGDIPLTTPPPARVTPSDFIKVLPDAYIVDCVNGTVRAVP